MKEQRRGNLLRCSPSIERVGLGSGSEWEKGRDLAAVSDKEDVAVLKLVLVAVKEFSHRVPPHPVVV